MNDSADSQKNKESLPFDPMAVMVSVWAWRYHLVIWLLVSSLIGVGAGLLFGSRSWDSHCVMLFQPPSVELSGRVYQAPAVQTQLNLVKLRPNLEETRTRLQLPMELDALAALCDIANPRDTQLLVVKATYETAQQSASIANTLANVFMENQRRVRNEELADAQKYLNERRRDLASKLERLQQAAEQRSAVAKEPQDLQREIRSYQTKLDALDVIYEKALSEQKALQLKVQRVDELIEDVKTKIAAEEDEAAAVQGLSNLNIRVERIREAIMDDRNERTNDITLAQWERRLDFDKDLLEKGYLAQSVYDHEVAQYEKLKAQAVDTEQIAEWKEELKDLYNKIRPTNKKDTASAPILRDLMLRQFNLKLEYDGTQEHIGKTKESRDRIAKDLQILLDSRNTRGAEGWQVQSWRDELSEIDRSLTIVRSLRDSDASDFQIVSPAEAVPLPSKSNRRLLAIGATGMLGMLGVGLVLVREGLRTRVRTIGEVSLVTTEPVLGAIAQESEMDREIWFRKSESVEQVRRAAQTIFGDRQRHRLMIVGCHSGDGATTIAAQIAASLARQQRRVTMVDADFRSPNAGLAQRLSFDAETLGLANLLDDSVDNTTAVVRDTERSNLRLLGPGTSHPESELFGSERMQDILTSLESRADDQYVILDGPPVCEYSDAGFLAQHVDGVLLVVRSEGCSRKDLRIATERIRESGRPLLGIVLNGVADRFL